METYISRRQNKITQFIMTRPIMGLCLEAKGSHGPRLENWWWEQEGLELYGMQMETWEAEREEGGGRQTQQRQIRMNN